MEESFEARISRLKIVQEDILKTYSDFQVRESCLNDGNDVFIINRLRLFLNEEEKLISSLMNNKQELFAEYFIQSNNSIELYVRLRCAFEYYKMKNTILKSMDRDNDAIDLIIWIRQEEFYLRFLQNEIDNTGNFDKRKDLISKKYKYLSENMGLEDIFINKTNLWHTEYSGISNSREHKDKWRKGLDKLLEAALDELFRHSDITFRDDSDEILMLKIKFKSTLLLFDKEYLHSYKSDYLRFRRINTYKCKRVIEFVNESIEDNIKNKGTIFNLRLVK